MDKKPKLLAFDDVGYARPWREIFDVIVPDKDYSMLENIKRADCILFTGGADISPALYDHNEIAGTFTQPRRDNLEEVIFRIAIDEKKAVLGICRGAQLACAMAGGFLAQDVNAHSFTHDMTTEDGQVLTTSSLHHQMMVPIKIEHKLLAWAQKRSSTYKCGKPLSFGQTREVINVPEMFPDGREPEVVYFPTIRALGIQGHPEMMHNSMDKDRESLVWMKQQAMKHLFDEVFPQPAA